MMKDLLLGVGSTGKISERTRIDQRGWWAAVGRQSLRSRDLRKGGRASVSAGAVRTKLLWRSDSDVIASLDMGGGRQLSVELLVAVLIVHVPVPP